MNVLNSGRRARPLAFVAVVFLVVLLGIPGAVFSAPLSAESTPTATPVSGPAVIVKSEVANVRSGPGTAYEVIGQASQGQRLSVTGVASGGEWWQVDLNGKSGWVSALLVTASPETTVVKVVAAPATPSVAATSKVAAASPTVTVTSKVATASPTAATASKVVSTTATVAPATSKVVQPTPAPTATARAIPESVTLDASTKYPVQARRITGQGYEFVDASANYDLVLNRDVFGQVAQKVFGSTLYQRHSKGVRITLMDADTSECGFPIAPIQFTNRGSKCANQALLYGFGDGEGAWITVGCAIDTPQSNYASMWDPEECFIAVSASGPRLTDIVVAGSLVAYGNNVGWLTSPPNFRQDQFAPLGKANRNSDSGQWIWDDPFLTIVPVASKVTSAAPTAVATRPGKLAPPAGHIAFTQARADNSDIAVVDVATQKTWVAAEYGRQPDIRTDGVIAFDSTGANRYNIYSVDILGKRLVKVSAHPEDSYPAWSPSGRSVALQSTMEYGESRLYVQWDSYTPQEPERLRADSKTLGGLVALSGGFPTWVDANRIAYSGCDAWGDMTHCGIWVINPSNPGSGPVQLTRFLSDHSTDSYNGQLLYASNMTGNWDVYTVSTGGGKAVNLTSQPGDDLGATYSPDGNYIAFMSNRSGQWGIWIMNADGSNQHMLMAVPQGFGKVWQDERLAWGP